MTGPTDPSENQLHAPSGRSWSRRVIDWHAMAGFLAHWVFTICAYSFYVLLLALVGGMLGGFLDFALVWVNRQWAGYGTQVGWVLGAVLAAIGLPLGWVRPNDKKFSFPSPGKLTRSISDRVAQRRAAKTERAANDEPSGDIRTLSDIVKGAGLCSLIFAILGLLLGMGLIMCWFSLAMSPFAPGGWFNAIDWDSEQGGGMSVSTSDPRAALLALGPVLILGGVGFAVGAVYGVFAYAKYLRVVPPDVRAELRRQRIASLRGKSLPWYVLVIGMVLASLGSIFSFYNVERLHQALSSRNWPQAPGRIIESKVESAEDSDGERHHSAVICYEYTVNGVRHAGQGVSFSDFASNSSGRARRMVRRYPAGKSVAVYHHPREPQRSVLEPGRPQGPLLFSGLSLIVLVIGFYVLFHWTERWLANRRLDARA